MNYEEAVKYSFSIPWKLKMTTGPSPEVLVMNQFPPNTYLRFYQTPEKVK